jgi:hypothetical protein
MVAFRNFTTERREAKGSFSQFWSRETERREANGRFSQFGEHA